MWVQSESWKRSPNGSQLVWLVSADRSRRAGIVYTEYKDPAKLLAWMESVAVFDGRVVKPTDAQVRAAAIGHLRSELHDTTYICDKIYANIRVIISNFEGQNETDRR